MKIPRSEFKAVIKECLKELINEGALNNVVSQLIQTQGIPVAAPNMQMQQTGPIDPRVQMAAQSVARNGADAKLYEAIFADAYGTMTYQNGGDPQLMMQQQNAYGMMPMQQPMMQGQGYFGGYPQQQMMPNQYGMQQQMMPMQQPQQQGQSIMLHQQQPSQPQNGQGGGMSRWAQLAYNSPIKNRPDSEGGGMSLGNGGNPGSNMGKFD